VCFDVYYDELEMSALCNNDSDNSNNCNCRSNGDGNGDNSEGIKSTLIKVPCVI
jgi:hypothetical protein